MEKIYKKVGKRYIEVGYNTPDLVDGIWLVQTKRYSKSQSNLVFRIGDLQSPRDIVTQGAMLSMEDELSNFITALTNENSEEFKNVKARLRGLIKEPIGFYGISSRDLASIILSKIAESLEKTEKTEWAALMIDFRSEYNIKINNQNNQTQTKEGFLWDFIEWLEKKGYELKQHKI